MQGPRCGDHRELPVASIRASALHERRDANAGR